MKQLWLMLYRQEASVPIWQCVSVFFSFPNVLSLSVCAYSSGSCAVSHNLHLYQERKWDLWCTLFSYFGEKKSMGLGNCLSKRDKICVYWGMGSREPNQTKPKQPKEDKIEHSNYFSRSAFIMC